MTSCLGLLSWTEFSVFMHSFYIYQNQVKHLAVKSPVRLQIDLSSVRCIIKLYLLIWS